MRWFFPSWNGDVRLEQDGENCRVLVISPTPYELEVLNKLQAVLVKKKYLDAEQNLWVEGDGSAYRDKPQSTALSASLSKVAPLFTKILKPGKQTLTAVSFKDGSIETVQGSEVSEALAKKAEDKGKDAATVKRPTPCCPQCVPGAVGPASEVLLSFLNEDEHRMWAQDRCLVVEGHLTGHRYLLAHRHTERAARIGRICYDLDSQEVIHFHDNSVPPEEEVLAAKLCLEHAEPWLRNEATLFNYQEIRFKNPFGDIMDGTADAFLTNFVGGLALGHSVGKKLTGQS